MTSRDHAAEGSGAADHYLAARIRERLAQDARVSELGIDVRVRSGEVFLDGVVPTQERWEAISALVEDLLPDHRIHNATRIAPRRGAGDVEFLP